MPSSTCSRATGYQGLTVAAVAARAGTTKPAVYRRWPTKAQLVHEAVFPVADRPLVPDGDDLVADLRAMVAATAELFGRPEVRAAVPGLLAEFARDPDTPCRTPAACGGTGVGRHSGSASSGRWRPGKSAPTSSP